MRAKHGGITSVNPTPFQKAELLDEIVKYARVPKAVVAAHREHAAKEAKAAKKR